MTQLDVLDYVLLPEHNCCVFKEKIVDLGIQYFVRNLNDKKRMAIIYPQKEGKTYTCGSVCNICNNLNIPIPEYAIHIQDILNEAKEGAKRISDEDKHP